MPGLAGGKEEPQETSRTVPVSRPGWQSGYNLLVFSSIPGYHRLGHELGKQFCLLLLLFVHL